MPDWIEGLATPWLLLVFALAGVTIVVVGTRFTGVVDMLADRTGMGEAIAGAVFMGATTSLPDIVVSTTTAASGHPELAMSNAIGGVAVQTAFLAVADITYRRANLEHAAASLTNMLEATLLIALISFPIVAMATPEIAFWGVHPASVAMLLAYGTGLRWINQNRDSSAWKPADTSETVADEDESGSDKRSTARLWAEFAIGACAVVVAGYVVAESGVALTERTGLSESAVGAAVTGVVTSSGELVTSIAAVRRGALTLAVGGVVGGNTFDSLLVAGSDFAYREGSIYHAVGEQPLLLSAATVLMTAILLMGLLSRQKYGWGKIGFESVLILAIYLGTIALVVTT